MRLRFMLAGGVMLSIALLLGSAQAQDEIAASIAKTSTPPVIDGNGDDAVWASADAHTLDEFFEVRVTEPLDGPDDLQITWKALWDDDNLYVLVEVNDDELVYGVTNDWQDDSIEIYIDAQNLDEPEYRPSQEPEIPSYQFTVLAGAEPLDDTTSLFAMGTNSYASADDITQYPQGADVGGMVTSDEDVSYSFEVAFPWEALEETPQNIIDRGDFGFGIAINDNDQEAGRDVQVMWATEEGDLWRDASLFPSVELIVGDVFPVGDFNKDGELNSPDIDDLTGQSAGGQNPALYDLNEDTLVDDVDIQVWVRDLFGSWVGDANLDGEFSSTDLVVVLASGTYEVETDAVWSTGDFNGDGRANSGDLVAALSDGGYEAGPRAATAAIPEPSALALLSLGALALLRVRRRD